MRKLLWLVTLALLLTAPAFAWGAAKVTSSGIVYTTIQDAINNTLPFDLILIEGNLTYNENLVVANSNPVILSGGWDAAFAVQDPAAFPTIIDPARDGYNLTVLGSPGVTPWVILADLIFTNSHISTGNNFTGAVHAEANGGDVIFEAFDSTFEKFFTANSPGVMVFNALGVSSISIELGNNTIAHNFGFGDNMVFHADGPIQVLIEANIILDNHFDGTPGIKITTDSGASFDFASQNNLIANNSSLKGLGGAFHVVASTGNNHFTSINDTILKNLAAQAGGGYFASFQTSNTLLSFTNTIFWGNTAPKDPNMVITGDINFGAAFSDLGPVVKTNHRGTYFVKNNRNEDPKVLGYQLGKPYLSSKSKVIDKGVMPIAGTVTTSTVSALTDVGQAFIKNELVGRTVLFTNPAGEYRIVKSNTATGITFDKDMTTAPVVGSIFTILGAPLIDIENRTRPQGADPDMGCSEAFSFAAGDWDITGALFDIYTGKKVEKGTVILESLNGPGSGVNEVIKSAVSTDTGKYKFKKLPAGDYRITPYLVGYSLAPQLLTIVAADAIVDFDALTYQPHGQVRQAGDNAAINKASSYLTVDEWESNESQSGGEFIFNAPPGDFLVFLRKVVKTNNNVVTEFRFFPKTAEAFSAGINGAATGGDLNDLADATTPSPWTALGLNVLGKLIIITHADGTREMRVISSVGTNTLGLAPDLLAPVLAGDTYTIDPHGLTSIAEAGGTRSKIVDNSGIWGTLALGTKAVIVFHADGTVEYSAVDSVSGGNTLNLGKALVNPVAAGDRYAIISKTFVGVATGGGDNTLIDAAVPWGNSLLVGRPIAYTRQTANGKVKETRVVTAVDPGTGTITVDKDFGVAPSAGETYEIDLLNYDFVGEKIPGG